jgi:uncharacterized protein DUF1553/uncharacterized protein DUF1549
MKFISFIILFSVTLLLGAADSNNPYENGKSFVPKGKIDQLLLKNWKKNKITPAKTSSDATFMRRVYIDLIGTMPTLTEARTFLDDKSRNKRKQLIDQLLERDEFAQYWSLKWCDILRVKSEFPINLWPNAVQAYHHWIWDAIKNNMPYDEFARKLLTSSGSNFREPPVNFYRATQDKTPTGLAKVAALTFMGTRLENWPEKERKEFEKLFSRIGKKRTDEWKEEIIYLNPEPVDAMTINMPDGKKINIFPDQDPRIAFADWLIKKDNPWFTQSAVNRVWYWLFNRGIVHAPDDFKLKASTNTGNPAVNPELLDYLAKEFANSGYDLKKLCRLITNSAAYQQSCIPIGDMEKAEKYFAVYPIKRLDAEILIDTLSYLGNVQPKYMSVIPEPFTYIPRELRTITLADGSISSSLLETFGRAARDSGLLLERNEDTTYSQRLFMLNSPLILWKVSNSQKMKNILKQAKWNPKKIVNGIYLLILSRYASQDEFQTIVATYNEIFPESKAKNKSKRKQKKKRGKNIYQMASGLVWTLVNSKEFLFQH